MLTEGHDYAIVSCNSSEIGFGFFNVTNLAITSVMFRMCGGHPSSEVVKYVNETDQFLYYDSSVPMVLFFSHCYNIKLHNTPVSVMRPIKNDYHLWLRHRFVVGVNLCGDSEINILPGTASWYTIVDDNYYTSLMMVMFVYFTDTDLPPPALCNFHVTTYCARSPVNINYVDPKLSGTRVNLDHFGDFVLFLTQSFLVNINLIIGPPFGCTVNENCCKGGVCEQ